MKRNEINKDQGLRRALQQRNEAADKIMLSEDFTDRLMQRIEQKEERPKRRRMWLYSTIGAIAASILLLLTLHNKQHHVDIEKGTVIAQQTEQREQPGKPESQNQDGQRPIPQTEQQEKAGNAPNAEQMPIKAEQAPMMAQEKPAANQSQTVNQRSNVASAIQKTSTNISTTDSLDYYIDKIERELAQVDESLYIERMNKVIRADERLQRIVNSYILHNLDKEGRPQTAGNMYNVKTEQDEE